MSLHVQLKNYCRTISYHCHCAHVTVSANLNFDYNWYKYKVHIHMYNFCVLKNRCNSLELEILNFRRNFTNKTLIVSLIPTPSKLKRENIC